MTYMIKKTTRKRLKIGYPNGNQKRLSSIDIVPQIRHQHPTALLQVVIANPSSIKPNYYHSSPTNLFHTK